MIDRRARASLTTTTVIYIRQYSPYDGKRIFDLLQQVSAELTKSTFTPLPMSVNPAYRCVRRARSTI